MTCLLDTHFLVWIISNSSRLRNYPWLPDYQPWCISPVCLLEIQLLAEVGRHIDNSRFTQEVMADPRFQLDDVSVVTLMLRSLELSWTLGIIERLFIFP